MTFQSPMQDTDAVVRMCMCGGLPSLALAVGPTVASAVVLPELIELVEDEEMAVRGVACSALAQASSSLILVDLSWC